jgi:Predicted membrane protein (DUF2232)
MRWTRDSSDMVQIVLIALGAGLASALLFASLLSGSLLAILLCCLAPLPVLIAAIGWTHWAGLVAATIGAASLAPFVDVWSFVIFLLGVGFPAWWLGYLTLLARVDGDARLDWYPVGMLVLWAALLGALATYAWMISLGTDATGFRTALRAMLEEAIRLQTHSPADTPLEVAGIRSTDRLLDVMVLVLPPAGSVLMTLTYLVNLWLAGRVVRVSGHLRRPWPELSSTALPTFASALLAAAFAMSFLAGLLGIMATVLAASVLMAFGIVGFAVLHVITRNIAARGVLLGATYLAVVILHWPVIMLMALGLIDAVFDLRGRLNRGRAPPPTSP